MKVLGIIPARYASTRFPGKPLVDIGGRSMIERVYRQASAVQKIDEVIVATDDTRIYEHVRSFGGKCSMTADHHQSGTDRCAEIAEKLSDYSIIVNIQGDEPFLDPIQIDTIITPLLENGAIEVSTLAKKITENQDISNPNVVKVVFNARGEALYFSRAGIPYLRNQHKDQEVSANLYFKHIGLYGFKRHTLLHLTSLPLGKYEQAESLEQLRWLEAGHRIHVVLTELETMGIDSPEDLEKIRHLF